MGRKLSELLTPPLYTEYKYLWLPSIQGGYAANLVGAGVGDPIQGEVGTTGVGAIRFQVDGDTHVFCPVWLPDELDVNRDISFKLIWSIDQVAGDGITFDILYSELTLDSSAMIAGATALSTAIGADTGLGAGIASGAGWGVLDGGTLTGTAKDGKFLSLTAKLTSDGDTTPATETVLVYGILIRYEPRSL